MGSAHAAILGPDLIIHLEEQGSSGSPLLLVSEGRWSFRAPPPAAAHSGLGPASRESALTAHSTRTVRPVPEQFTVLYSRFVVPL